MRLERATAWSLLPILTLSVLSIAPVPVYYCSLGTELYALWVAIQTMTGTFGFMDLGLGVPTGRYVGMANESDGEINNLWFWQGKSFCLQGRHGRGFHAHLQAFWTASPHLPPLFPLGKYFESSFCDCPEVFLIIHRSRSRGLERLLS